MDPPTNWTLPAAHATWPPVPYGYPGMDGAEFVGKSQLRQLQLQPQSDESQQSQLHEMTPLMDRNQPQISLPSSFDSSYGDFRFEMQPQLHGENVIPTPPTCVSNDDAPLVPQEGVDGGIKAKSDKKSGALKDAKKNTQSQQKRGRKRKTEKDHEEKEESSFHTLPAKRMTPDCSIDSALAHFEMPEDGGEIFCSVVGRLAVVGSQNTYLVSVSEIHRRLDLPECLTRGHVGSLLRRGRVTGCGNELQTLLEKHGLSSTGAIVVNRKRFPLTTLNALLEGTYKEALQLSADHMELVRDHFPVTVLARLVVTSLKSPIDLRTASNDVKAAKVEIAKLLAVLEEWTNGGWEVGKNAIFASPLRKFALLTHGFGVQEMMMMTNLFDRFLHTLDAEFDAQYERLAQVTQNNAFATTLSHFPPGMQQPALPTGHLHKADVDEAASNSGSFAEIAGRLALTNRKYNVTVAEVRRRIRAPESLNLSYLGSLLRKGKANNSGNALHDQLQAAGISIEMGRRKSHRITCFTAMVEGEAVALAKDVEDEVTRSFPFGPLADKLIEKSASLTPQVNAARRDGFIAASRIAGSLEHALVSFTLPVAERETCKLNEYAFTMLDYSSLTHGYGPDAVRFWMGNFKKIFDIASHQMSNV